MFNIQNSSNNLFGIFQMEYYLEHIESVYGAQERVRVNAIGTTHEGRTVHEVLVRPYSKLIVRNTVVVRNGII